jgi:hypothetical protein
VFFSSGDLSGGSNNERIEYGVMTIVRKEGSHIGGRVDGVVVAKFSQGEQRTPIILLIIAEDTKILFQDLIKHFSGSISLRVKGGGEVDFDMEEFSETCPKG